MLNKIILVGRLTRDPEPRYTTSGIAVTRFTLAVDRPFSNAQGEREADFIDIVTWRKMAENCANHLGKGYLVAVEGHLQIRSYDDNQGIRRKAAEVVANNVRFLDRGKQSSGQEQYQQSQQSQQFSSQQQDNGYNNANDSFADNSSSFGGGFASEINFSDDDVPF